MTPALALLVYLGIPGAILLAVARLPLAARIGPIVLCYALGLLLGLSAAMPAAATPLRDTLTEVSLALALPLLLFSVDVRAWGTVAGRALLSMALAVAAVICVALLLWWQFSAAGTARAEELSAMAVGMYTGGIANLGAMKVALGIEDARYLAFATVDTAVGALYLLFVLTLAPPLFARLLPEGTRTAAPVVDPEAERPRLVPALIALFAAAVCVAGAVLLAPLIAAGNATVLTIVLLTTFGIAGSFVPALRRNAAATPLGMFAIYVFTFCVAASLDVASLARVEPAIALFVLIATVGTFMLHALLCRLFRIDAGTFLITSVAAILSPAFVPMVARRLGDRGLLMSGMATGILGFAIGNYLGIGLALLLRQGGAP